MDYLPLFLTKAARSLNGIPFSRFFSHRARAGPITAPVMRTRKCPGSALGELRGVAKSATFRRNPCRFGRHISIPVYAARERGRDAFLIRITHTTFRHLKGCGAFRHSRGRGAFIGYEGGAFRLRRAAGIHRFGGGSVYS